MHSTEDGCLGKPEKLCCFVAIRLHSLVLSRKCVFECSSDAWIVQVPSNFRFVVEQTLREFFKAIQEGRDAEQSWKKSIYKIISRLDDPVPEYFKSPNFLEQLE